MECVFHQLLITDFHPYDYYILFTFSTVSLLKMLQILLSARWEYHSLILSLLEHARKHPLKSFPSSCFHPSTCHTRKPSFTIFVEYVIIRHSMHVINRHVSINIFYYIILIFVVGPCTSPHNVSLER